nr:retrovirus-related Pol polyprotein from transposon TNT 1-94 [Tanacetum cinerariifolium]
IIIGTKWVFRNKLDKNSIVSLNKVGLVTQRYNQQDGIDYDETYASIARLESIRKLLAYACALDFKLFQIDIKSALLNGFINEEVYVAQPSGFIDFKKPDHLYIFKKALYGLKQAPKLGLWYLKGTAIEIVVYADSDHVRDYVDRKSTSGVCTFLGCCLTSWFSKKQTPLAVFTIKAEYVSAGKACQQALWMKQALIDYNVQLEDIPIMCDNKGAIGLSKNPVQHSRTKHIEIRYNFLRDNVQKGHISIKKVPSVDKIAVTFCLGLRFALEDLAFCLRRPFVLSQKILRFVLRRSCILSSEDLAFCLQKILRFVFRTSCVLSSKILHFAWEALRFVFKEYCILSLEALCFA